ncbi:hemerythrin-like metal-binding domain protein [Malonomonas rubra DSM 5091]|uniref:Hemerythrin-like metal-binding domain protein n=1 Tax=Malonomonas rubra DSM 5091 TaxID=1122189 RepID=A0A1M6GAX0_MALRU|nr:bacteriohemerythrin [Malonomonas rubra]SHJ07029.1 hemerythrin-like metal-binding domain protein [Malonomonas rubra DSM 5091]
MFDNFKIGAKLALLSGIVLTLLLIILVWGVTGLSTTADNGLEVSSGNKLRADLSDLEIKHLKWAHKVRDFLNDSSVTELKVKLDHKTCALGSWYYGEERRKAEELLPEIADDLRALEEPHRLLHASGRKIKESYNPYSPTNADSKAIYKKETAPALKEIGRLMASMAETSKEHVMTDTEMITAAHSSRTGMTIVGVIALAIGIILSWLISRSLTVPMRKTVSMIEELENGHLDSRLQMQRKDEIGQMATTMDRFADSLQHEVVDSLQKLANGDLRFEISPRDGRDLVRGSLQKLGVDLNNIITQVQTASDQIASGSVQVSDSAQSLSEGATRSAASLEEIGSSMNVISTQTNQSADNAVQANQLASDAAKAATTGNERMTEMITAMGEINDAGQNISKIIKVIDEIAFQTNLLALNAAVEAARAGQHGKGFAVVAEEVRNLAARSAKAASETAELIEGSVEKASNGTQIAERTADSLKEIVDAITKVDTLLEEIATSSKEQASGVGQINQGLQQIDQVIQQNTASAEESAATSEELSGQAAELKNQLAHFSLKGNQQNFAAMPAPSFSAPATAPASSGWGALPQPAPAGKQGGLRIDWSDSLATGIPIVDRQHQGLIELINRLFKCMQDGGDRMLLGQIIDELVDYTVNHFRTEEDLMQKTHYKDFQAHKQTHDNFVGQVGEYMQKLKDGERLAAADVYKFLKDWLISHIEKQDRDGYAPHVRSRM